MPRYSFEGRQPRVHPEAFVAPTATLVGDVTVEAGASVWYGEGLAYGPGPGAMLTPRTLAELDALTRRAAAAV
jgi:hypothetical protein